MNKLDILGWFDGFNSTFGFLSLLGFGLSCSVGGFRVSLVDVGLAFAGFGSILGSALLVVGLVVGWVVGLT